MILVGIRKVRFVLRGLVEFFAFEANQIFEGDKACGGFIEGHSHPLHE